MSNHPGEFIRSILEAFGSYARTAEILKTPESTVYFWARNKNIPHWRRSDVLKAVKRRKIVLTEQQLAYLQSNESAKYFLKKINQEPNCSGMGEDHQSYTLAAHPYNKEF